MMDFKVVSVLKEIKTGNLWNSIWNWYCSDRCAL